jgi:putative membrane protein
MSAPDPTLRALAALAAAAVVVAWLLAIVSTVLTFGDFELRREGDRLLISHGLLERRRSSIPIARIQAVTVSEGWLRQPFGLAAVRVESAGYGKTSGESGILAPIIRCADLPRLIDRACPAYAVDLAGQPLHPLPQRARRRYVVSGLWFALAISFLLTLLAAFLPWTPWWWGGLALCFTPVAVAYGLLEFRDAGWHLDGADRFVLRIRGIDRVTAITLRRRLQERSVSQHPFQRRAALATLHIAVASGGAGGRYGLVHLDAAVAADLMQRLGPRRSLAPNGSPPAATLTTIGGDHDDSPVELRTASFPGRHDRDAAVQWAPGPRPTDDARAAPPRREETT